MSTGPMSTGPMRIPRVALVGAAGHGASHLRNLTAAQRAGKLDLVGVCDLRPIETPAPLFTDHRAMLDAVDPDVVVVCTPPHTHLAIATDALRSGADLLLEKPPVLSLSEHATLSAVLGETGRCCQVGFQAQGSAALAQLRHAIRTGVLGTVGSVSAAGAWWRGDEYYARAPWAGRRAVGGRPVLDGALANPFAHALMCCLSIAAVAGSVAGAAGAGSVAGAAVADAGAGAGWPESVAVERYRTAVDIEVDDTACVRVESAGGPPVLVAVSLRSAGFVAGEVTVTGTGGRATLEYPTDRLALPGEPGPRQVPGRVDLLANLLAHRSDPAGVPLLAPLSDTAPFTAVIEVLRGAPEPHLIDARYLEPHAGGAAVDGIADLVRRAAGTPALFSELGVAWAAPPHLTKIAPDEDRT